MIGSSNLPVIDGIASNLLRRGTVGFPAEIKVGWVA